MGVSGWCKGKTNFIQFFFVGGGEGESTISITTVIFVLTGWKLGSCELRHQYCILVVVIGDSNTSGNISVKPRQVHKKQ